MPYLATSDLEARLVDFDPSDAAQVAAVEAMIAEASALIDAETGEVFAVTGSPAARVVYGNGTGYLTIAPHGGTITTDDIVIASGAAVPSFVDRGRYLVTTDTSGDLEPGYGTVWPEGQKITITAAWGESAIPADLATACRELVISWWVRSYTDRPESTPAEYPEIVRGIITRYRNRKALRGAFA